MQWPTVKIQVMRKTCAMGRAPNEKIIGAPISDLFY